MRLLIIIFLLSLSSCDSGSKPQAQAGNSVAGEKSYISSKNINIDSKDRVLGELIYDFAGQKIPNAPFKAPDGSSLTLERYKGRPILLNLWATYCPPCRFEMPTLDKLAASEEGRVTVLTISQDLQGGKVVRPYFKKNGFENILAYTSADNAIWKQINKNTGRPVPLPSTILYDSNGIEVWRIYSDLEWDNPKIVKFLRQAS